MAADLNVVKEAGAEKPNAKSIFVFLILLVLIHFATLHRYPAPFVDEGWLGSRAWVFRETHQAAGPLDRGVFDRFPGYWTYFPWIPNYLQHLTFLTSSAPSFKPLRILSLLGGFLLLASLFAIARRLCGLYAAWLTVCLVGFSRSFLYSAHLARYDILVAAFGFTAIALSLRAGSKVWPHLVAGLMLGAAFETHPVGALYVPVVTILYFIQERSATLKNRRFWAFVAGGLIGMVFYVALHIIPYPETWAAMNRIAGSHTHRPPFLSADSYLESLRGTWQLAFYIAPYTLPLALIALVFFLLHRDRKSQILITLLIGIPLLHSALLQHKLAYYAILFSPVLELSVAVFLVQVSRYPWRVHLLRDVARVAAYVMVLCAIIYSMLPLRWDWSQDYYAVETQLKQKVRSNETIMGTQVWWFALPKNQWYSWETLYYFRQLKPETNLEDAFREFHPDIFILDGHLASFIRPGNSGSYADQLGVRENELNEILRKYGRLREEFDAGYYGPIRVFELHWTEKRN